MSVEEFNKGKYLEYYSIPESEIINSDRTGLKDNSCPCYSAEVITHSVELTTGLQCNKNCDTLETGEIIMSGEILVIKGSDNVLDNVIMITDGIDFTGENDVYALLEGAGGCNRFQELLDYGMDLVIVDWPDPMGYIENNSQYLQSILQDYAEDGVEVETLLGISMGGIISRHALLEMEERGEEHKVINWISGDSPQEGSNVAIGVQSLARELAYFVSNTDNNLTQGEQNQLNTMEMILDSPAARQMLLHNVSGDDFYRYILGTRVYGLGDWIILNSVNIPLPIPYIGGTTLIPRRLGSAYVHPRPHQEHVDLYSDLRERGYPIHTLKNISIADGSLDRDNRNCFSGDVLLRILSDNAEFLANASNGRDGKHIFDKKYKYIHDHRSTIEYDIYNIDCAAGSKFNVGGFSISENFNFLKSFTHATTSSAIGIPGDPNNWDINDSPFDYIIGNDVNNFHTDFSGDYGRMKYEEIRRHLRPELFDCVDLVKCEDSAKKIRIVEEEAYARRLLLKVGNNTTVQQAIITTRFPDPVVTTVRPGEFSDLSLGEFDIPEWVNALDLVVDSETNKAMLMVKLNYEKITSLLYQISGSESETFPWFLGFNPILRIQDCEGSHDYSININYKFIVTDRVENDDCPKCPDVVNGDESLRTRYGNNENIDKDVVVYPNPSSGKYQIQNLQIGDKLILSGPQGKVLSESTVINEGNHTIDITDRNAGVYYLIVDGNMSSQVLKLIKVY